MIWLRDHLELVLSLSGISLTTLIGWAIWYFTRLRKFIRGAEDGLKLATSVIESHENVIRRMTELDNRLDQLFNTTVQFPDPSKFALEFHVYWFIGDPKIHSNNSPLCPICLTDRKSPIPLTPTAGSRWECYVCGYHLWNHFVSEKYIQGPFQKS